MGDRDEAAAGRTVVLDQPRDLGEQRVVAALAHTGPGVDLRATLTDKDRPGRDELALEALHPKPL